MSLPIRNVYTKVNPLLVIATKDVELEKAVLTVDKIIENKKAILRESVKVIENQPQIKKVKVGQLAWLMFSWDQPHKKSRVVSSFSAMFFFDDEPISWNWVTENRETFQCFKTIDQIVTNI